MSEDTPNELDCYEKQYNRYQGTLSLTDSAKNLSDKIIEQCLQRDFNNNANIPTDYVDVRNLKKVDIEREIIDVNAENWNPDHNDTIIPDALYSFIKDRMSELPSEEQQQSNALARQYTAGNYDSKNVVEAIIERTPSLNGFTIEDAKNIAQAELSGQRPTETLQKFSECDQNMIKAVAYTMLHVNKDTLTEPEFENEDFSEHARSYMHYTTEESAAYESWENAHRENIINDLSTNPEIISDIKRIKAASNVTNLDEVEEQFTIRQRIADAAITAFAKSYGLSDILTPDDITTVHASGKKIMSDKAGGYMTDKMPGILNDETIILRYNPLFEHMESNEHTIKTYDTDQEEIQRFLAMTFEEVQHGIDQVHTDKLILGTLPADAPLHMHATLTTLNSLTRFGGGQNDYESYANQYFEKTAKIIADGLSTAITNNIAEQENGQMTAQVTQETTPSPIPKF